jgi:hypothetical protein
MVIMTTRLKRPSPPNIHKRISSLTRGPSVAAGKIAASNCFVLHRIIADHENIVIIDPSNSFSTIKIFNIKSS